MVDAVNQRVGFDIFCVSEATKRKVAEDERPVEWRYARQSMSDAFCHLQLQYGLVPQVELPSENGSTFKICARKLCAGAASGYTPQFPSQTEWREDGRLQEALRSGMEMFVVRMIRYSVGAQTTDGQREAAEVQGPTSESVKTFPIEELLRRMIPGMEDMRRTCDMCRLAARAVEKFLESPAMLFAIADEAKTLPTEEDQRTFLGRIILVVGESEAVPAKQEIVALIRRAKKESASGKQRSN